MAAPVVVANECMTMTSAMRKNTRWAQSGVAAILGAPLPEAAPSDEDIGLATRLGFRPRAHSSKFENPLIVEFARLRNDMLQCKNIEQYDSLAILDPFLEVVSSQSTTGLITSLALTAISKFFSYKVLSKDSANIEVALAHVSIAVTHCRFEATDQAEDDGVLLQLLRLMEDIVCGPTGQLLSDDSLCEIVETCLSMACQMRRGDILRRAAEMTMIRLCQSVFSRLNALEPEDREIFADESRDNIQLGDQLVESNAGDEQINNVVVNPNDRVDLKEKSETSSVDGEKQPARELENDRKPFGIFSIREVFRVLLSVIDPANSLQYTDTTRIMSLKLLNIALEVSGHSFVDHPSLLSLSTTTLCKHLLQLIRNDNVYLLQMALSTTLTFFRTMAPFLKLQQEFFLTYILTSLTPLSDLPQELGVDSTFYRDVPNRPKLVKPPPVHLSNASTPTGRPGTPASTKAIAGVSILNFKPAEVREAMVEGLTVLCRSDSFFTDLFVNYDCAVDRTDLCEDLIGFLCRTAYPDSAGWSSASVPPLCLEAILACISSLSFRLSEERDGTMDDVQAALETKARKNLVISVTDAFNTKAKMGIALMIERGLVEENSPASLARFLKDSGRLNKTALGAYLGNPKNSKVLECFIEDYDFSNKRIDEALREFLCSFRLPGESQQIERIFETFAKQYCSGENNTMYVANDDAAFVLSYAVIMLNTDAHSPQVKRQMTLEEFKRNLRQSNDGKDFDQDYLEDIYRAIKSKEIIMPDEHDTDETFELAWKSLLLKTPQAGNLTSNMSSSFDKPMFECIWKPIVTTLSYVFYTATDDTVFSRVLTAFNQIAKIASHYDMPQVIDRIAECLAKISGLAASDGSAPSNKAVIKRIEHGEVQSVSVSDLTVAFGSDAKAQMAAVTLFRIVDLAPTMTTEGWATIIRILSNLYLHDLINPVIIDIGLPPLPQTKPSIVFDRSKTNKESGLFSTLSSYLSGYNDSSQEPSEMEIEMSLSAVECVGLCRTSQVLTKLMQNESEQAGALINTLVSELPNVSSRSSSERPLFYAITLYYFELVIALATQNESTTGKYGKIILGKLQELLTQWDGFSSEFLNRIVAYCLTLARKCPQVYSKSPKREGAETFEERDSSPSGEFEDIVSYSEELKTVLSLISSIQSGSLISAAPSIVAPLLELTEPQNWTRPVVLQDDSFWTILETLARNGKCSRAISEFIDRLSKDNYKDVFEDRYRDVFKDNFAHVIRVIGTLAMLNKAEQARRSGHKTPGKISPQHKKHIEALAQEDLKRAEKSLELLNNLDTIVWESWKNDSKVDEIVRWSMYYDYAGGLAGQCTNPIRDIRVQALSLFQRSILSRELRTRDGLSWADILDKLILPLVSTLLRPEVYEVDPAGMAATRLQAASLLCKVFLEYVVQIQQQSDEFLRLWVNILETLDRLISSGQKDSLRESVVESLKNVILVVSASDFGADDRFWEETWKKIDSFLPGFKGQVLPPATQEKRPLESVTIV